jgi:hypothetical protein
MNCVQQQRQGMLVLVRINVVSAQLFFSPFQCYYIKVNNLNKSIRDILPEQVKKKGIVAYLIVQLGH